MILFLRARGRAAAARALFHAKRAVAAWTHVFFLLLSLVSWGTAAAQTPSWVRPDQYYVFFSMPPSCPTAPNLFGFCVLGEEYVPAAKAICGLIGLPLHPLFETTPPCDRCGFSSPVHCLSPTSDAPAYAGNLFGTSACNLAATEFAKLYPNDTGGHWVSCTPPPAVIDPNKNNGCSNAVGNPCNAATGNKFEIERDYQGVGAHPLQFVRYYNSARARTFAGALGAGWSHTYDRSVSGPQLIDPTRNNYANATRPDGNIYRFNLVNGQWLPDGDVPDRLVQLPNASGWRYTRADDEVETYSASGRLIALRDRAGRMQTLDYDALGRLLSVRDPFGRALQFAYDVRGRIATLTDPGSGVFTFVYDGDNDLASVRYPDGAVRSYLYNERANTQGADQKNYLTGIVDENGDRYATFKYDFTPRVVSTEHAGGVEKYAFVQQSDGSTAVIDPLGTSRNYRFQTILSVAKNASVQGAPCPSCGNAATSYDANGFVSSRTDFNGNVTKFQRTDALGRLDLETARTEAFGKPEARTVSTEWDSSFRLPHRIAEPLRITTTSYDTHGNVLSKTIQATSDTTGALSFNATPTGNPRTWSYAYTYSDTIPGHVTHVVVDGPRSDVADTTTYDWDNSGNLISITNALGHLTTLGDYDAHGRAQLITDPNGLTTALVYDARGRITSRNVGGEITSYVYDGVGQLKTLTLPEGSALSYTYDAAHRLTQIQDSLGNHIVYTLDAMGNRIQEQVFDPLNTLAQVRSRAYDALNRLSQDIGGTNPLTQVTQYGYDDQGNLTSVTDPLGHRTANVYDALDRLAKVIDPAAAGPAAGAATHYAHDGADQLTQISDPRSLATTYTLDGLGNLTRLASPDTGMASSAFDAAGNLLSQIDARGVRASFNYDPLNRIIRATYTPAASSTATAVSIVYTYDQGPYALGRLTGISDANGSVSYGYESHGRLVSDVRTLAGVSYATIYSYDPAGRLTRIVYPSGRTVDYSLDALGRIKQIDTSARGITQSVVSGVTYQPFGAATSFVFGNAQGVVRKLDLDGRTASYPLGGVTRNVIYDAASRITAFKHANAVLDQTFQYDNLDRLTGWSSADTSQSFNYDAVGNRTRQMIDATPYLSSYSSTSNRLASAEFPIAFNYQYDEAGNITQDALRSYSYDARARLTQIVASGVTTRFAFNGLGQRVWKSPSNGLPRVFLYDQAGHLIAESTPAGEVLREYIYLGDLPVALISNDHDDDGVPDARDNCMLDANPNQRDTSGGGFGNICNGDANGDGVVNQADLALVIALVHRPGTSNPAAAKRADMNGDGVLNYQDQGLLSQWIRQRGVPGPSGLRGQSAGPELFFIYADQIGTPRVLTDASNKVRWQWTATDPFGIEPPDESPQGDFISLPFNVRFPGQYYDRETGLHYNYFRDYDPGTGRYIESDPIGLRGGTNTYAYVDGNPASYRDPTGLFWQFALNPMVWGPPLIIGGYWAATHPADTRAIWNAITNSSSGSSGSSANSAGVRSKAKPSESALPDSANDAKYDDKECPPDCSKWRAVLNRMFHVINQYSISPTADPARVSAMWLGFSLEVKRYEKECGPYQPPPSLDDIYSR